jgi:hypothetical protein
MLILEYSPNIHFSIVLKKNHKNNIHEILAFSNRKTSAKSFAKVDCMDCEIITFEVKRILFFPLFLGGTAKFNPHWCKKI